MIWYSDENSMLLDDLVHDVASQQARNVNNDGMGSQVDYLLMHGFTLSDIEGWLQECKEA